MTKPKPKCPECGAIFSTVQLVAMHRSRAHGVIGMSKSSVDKRRLDARKAAEAEAAALERENVSQSTIVRRESEARQKTGAGLKCPQCDFVAANKVGLGVHLSGHKKIAEQPQEIAAATEQQGDQKTCTICGLVAKNERGMTVHMATTHRSESSETKTKTPTGGSELEYVDKEQQRSIERRAASQAKREAASDGIPEATLALALGRFQGLCASMALEFDLPPRRFASRLAELIFAAQVR
jgi:uncharacterized C2H2 Zn-finger protein